jgi:hypothetical protein
VKGTTRLTDEDGDRVLRGVGCSEHGEGGVTRTCVCGCRARQWDGVGVVMHMPTNSLVILVF